MAYYLTYGVLLFAVVLGENFLPNYFGHFGRQLRTLLFWFLLLGLFVFTGFRSEVGCDWTTYEKIFNGTTFPGLGLDLALLSNELGYVGLISILNQYGVSYTYLNVVTSFIFFLGIHSLARRQQNPLTILVLAFPILIINLPMSGIRQAAAVGFICFAINSFIDKRLLKYILFIALAASFHSSAVCFLLLVPFIHGDFSKRNIFIASLALLPILPIIFSSTAFQLAIWRYVESGTMAMDMTTVNAAGAKYRVTLLALTGLVFIIYLAPKWRKLYPHDYKIVNIGAWGMVFSFGLMLFSSVIGDRVGYYLMPLQLIIFARLQFIPGKYRQLLYLAPFIVFTTLFVTWTQMSDLFNYCFIPYQIRF